VKRYYTNIMWEKDTLTPMTSQQMQMQSSEKWRRDYQDSEEVGEGKGKKRSQSLLNGPRELYKEVYT
jgi:hypothetical protein